MTILNWIQKNITKSSFPYFTVKINYTNQLLYYFFKHISLINKVNYYIYSIVLVVYIRFVLSADIQNFFSSKENIKQKYFIGKFYLNFQNNLVSYKYLLNKIKVLKLINYCKVIMYNLKWVWLAFILVVVYFFISLFYIQIDLTKQIVIWYILFILYYLLLSGFNTFLVKYRYGKFTSAIQRFWKRTGMIFWLIEGFLFLLFFYYFLNSSQEPLYMFDYSNLNQELVIQLKNSYKNLILLNLAIWLSFILLLGLNTYLFFQTLIVLFIILLIITYMLYLETYQFIYVISTFADKDWVFDEFQNIWVLEIEQNNLRVKQQYFILCLIAKYWHFIFIFISWMFFLLKSLEAGNVSITSLGYNTQNLLILSLLNLLCLVQWLKIIVKKFLEITYSWFFIEYDEKFFITLLYEFYTVISSYIFEFNGIVESFYQSVLTTQLYSISETFIWKL